MKSNQVVSAESVGDFETIRHDYHMPQLPVLEVLVQREQCPSNGIAFC